MTPNTEDESENTWDEEESVYCPVCDGEGLLMGSLGNRQHFYCRQCGAQFSQEKE